MNCAPSASQLGGTEHSKLCRRCGETLPVSSFPKNRHGNCRPCCHKCTHIERVERRASRPAWRNAHIDRLEREREARRIRKEYREAQANADQRQCTRCERTLPHSSFSRETTGKPAARCKPCAASIARERYHRKHGRSGKGTARGSIDPAMRREAADRINYLASLLKGLNPNQRITTAEEWDVTTSELQKLWHLSGDKECASCGAVVPSTAMRPPGPANFYPGKCNACARAECLANQLKVFGKITTEAPKILLRDGTNITVADFARRVRERQAP